VDIRKEKFLPVRGEGLSTGEAGFLARAARRVVLGHFSQLTGVLKNESFHPKGYMAAGTGLQKERLERFFERKVGVAKISSNKEGCLLEGGEVSQKGREGRSGAVQKKKKKNRSDASAPERTLNRKVHLGLVGGKLRRELSLIRAARGL